MGNDDIMRERSLAYWSGRAPEYSALHRHEYESEKREPFERAMDEFVGAATPGARALDLGCGSGFMTLLLAERGYRVDALDFSAEMLEEAERNLREAGHEGVSFHLGAVQELDFPQRCFDVVVSRNVTWVLDNVDEVYRRVFSVLEDGGVFLNIDANYGALFNEQDDRGERPRHKTQTLEQLRTRNALVRDIEITKANRPLWDASVFWELGAREVRAVRFGDGTGTRVLGQMFALVIRR